MPTRMIIIRDSTPLVGTAVKVEGHEHEFVTDDDGMVTFERGTDAPLTVVVHDRDEWVTRVIEPRDSQSLLVVDLSRRPTTDDFIHNSNLELGERYEFSRVLGRGGMGVVIEAKDAVLQRPVAVKMLNDELQANAEARQILLTEGQALAQLDHRHLVSVYDVASAEGRVFMVMEYVDGENLDDMLQTSGKLDQHLTVRAAIQLVEALAYLHDEKYIHRDVKPANCMLQKNGDLKLIDFGLARSMDHILARGTRVRGSPAYMAPEQIQGLELTSAADVYQVGVTLFEMVTGELPFSKGSLAYAHVHEAPPRADEVDADVLPGIAAAIAACLEKDPADRPTTVELADRLRDIDAKLSKPTVLNVDPTATPLDDGELASPRRGRLAALGAVALLAVLSVVVVVALGHRQTEAESGGVAAVQEPAAQRSLVPEEMGAEPAPEPAAAEETGANVTLARENVRVGIREATAGVAVLADTKEASRAAQQPEPTKRVRPEKRAARAAAPAEPVPESITGDEADGAPSEPRVETPVDAEVESPDEKPAVATPKPAPVKFEPKVVENVAGSAAEKPEEKAEPAKEKEPASRDGKKKPEEADAVPLGF